MSTNNFKPLQAQPFSIAGSGAVSGSTSVTLKSFQTIDGVNIAMSDLGTIAYMTLEPGNGTLEEQISFTGVTQNANGTATLTGVKTVLFVYPYTESSGTAKTHAGSTTAILSNTSAYYDQFLKKNDDGTITGLYQFPNGANTPVLGASYVAPTLQPQVASKGYVDAVAIAGAPNATTSVQGLVQLPTQAQVDAGTATGSTGASLTPTPALLRSKLLSDYVTDTGAANAYAIAPSPVISAYAVGQVFSFKAAHSNTTTSTVAVNGLTVQTIKKVDGATNLASGDIVVGQIVLVEYDGTNFQMLNPVGNAPATSAALTAAVTAVKAATNGLATRAGDTASGTQTIAHGLGAVPSYALFFGVKPEAGGQASTQGILVGSTNTGVNLTADTHGGSGAFVMKLADTSSVHQVATAAVDATNITLTWVRTGSTSADTMEFAWQVHA